MKTSVLSIILATALLFGCEGPEGPLGPQGPKGDTGSQGAKGDTGPQGPAGTNGTNGSNGKDGTNGTNGKDGNANVQSTDWMKLNLTGVNSYKFNYTNTAGAIYATYVSLATADDEVPILTQEALDKAGVFIYYKTKQSVYNQTNQEMELLERYSGGSLGTTNVYGSFKIPDRTTNNFNDFQIYYVNTSEISVKHLRTTVSFETLYNRTTLVSAAPELLDKTIPFYRDLFKEYPQMRIVVIPPAAQGRVANIDMTDYQAVKRAFNLQD